MAEDRPKEDAAINDHNEVSGPLQAREFHGNARCIRCKALDQESCVLLQKRDDLRCLTCPPTEECRFRRTVVKEDAAAAFTWEELISDASAEASITPNNVARKRLRSTLEDSFSSLSWSRVPPQSTAPIIRNIPSTFSEPPSQLRTDVSSSPHATRQMLGPAVYPTSDYRPGSAQLVYQNLLEVGSNMNMDPDVSLPRWFDSDSDLYSSYVLQPSYASPPHRFQHIKQKQQHNHLDEILESFSTNDVKYSPQHPVRDQSKTQVVDQVRNLLKPYPPEEAKAIVDSVRGQPSPAQHRISRIEDQSEFRCQECKEGFHTKSEMSKHMARHTKKWVCDHQTCPRGTEGFATKNDLDRHKASVHRDNTVSRKEYKCCVPGCKDPNKVWDRKDNFKAHVKRMHTEVDIDVIVEKSLVEDIEPDARRSSTPYHRAQSTAN